MHHLIPIDVSSASYVRDRKIIFTYLDTGIDVPTARAWLNQTIITRTMMVTVSGSKSSALARVATIEKSAFVSSRSIWSVRSTWAMGSAMQRRRHLGQSVCISLCQSTTFTTLILISYVICAIICMSKVSWQANIGLTVGRKS